MGAVASHAVIGRSSLLGSGPSEASVAVPAKERTTVTFGGSASSEWATAYEDGEPARYFTLYDSGGPRSFYGTGQYIAGGVGEDTPGYPNRVHAVQLNLFNDNTAAKVAAKFYAVVSNYFTGISLNSASFTVEDYNTGARQDASVGNSYTTITIPQQGV
jgi:hypothetical protein